jgi:Flp pilus assembly protein TadG
MSGGSVKALSVSTPRIALRARRRWLRDRSAAVALTFALSVLPVTLLIGIGIDLGFVTQSKAQLNAAADAAALAAATTAANGFTAGLAQATYMALGQTAGSQWFDSQGKTTLNTSTPTATVGVTQTGSVFLSTVTYQATVPTYFGGIVGLATIPVSGVSSATISTNSYVSVTFLLDNSSSMLIASTQAGVNQMNNVLTPVNAGTPGLPAGLTQQTLNAVPGANGLGALQCAFACHWDANNNDYYGLARNNHIQLRFDVVQSAVASAIGEMIHEEVIASQFGVGIYTFGNTLTQVYPSSPGQSTSTDLTSGENAAAAIQTPVGPDAANTDFPAVMAALAAASSAAGDGSTLATPRKALIIVTDGLADYGSRQIPGTEGPIDPANCTAMKNLGYSVYVLYTTYITTPSNLVLPFGNIDLLPYLQGTATPGMAASLQSCASGPTNYAEASDPAAINTAMTQMLKSALGNGGRFTK